MSFILDALKKSENERQRTIGPSLADAPLRAVRNEQPWWALAVGALLLINLAVLLFVLLRDDDTVAPVAAAAVPAAASAATVAPATTPAPAPAPMTSAPRSNDPSVRSLAEEAGASPDLDYYDGDIPTEGFVDPALAAAATVPDGPPAVQSIQPPAVTPLDTTRSNTARSNEVLPSASALIAGGTSLPPMRLDIHVYSNTPAERFVFINMRKYVEGGTLTEGPVLERITPDGAVLNQQGLRFVLPRQ